MEIYQYDATQLNTEITQCRQLGITAQEKYDIQQAEERAEIFALAVVGAAVWNALDCNKDSATIIEQFTAHDWVELLQQKLMTTTE